MCRDYSGLVSVQGAAHQCGELALSAADQAAASSACGSTASEELPVPLRGTGILSPRGSLCRLLTHVGTYIWCRDETTVIAMFYALVNSRHNEYQYGRNVNKQC